MRSGTLLAAVAFVAIFAGGFQPFYLSMWRTDREALRERLTALPFTKAPGFREFLLAAGPRIPHGAEVAFLAPFPRFEQGYRYHFSRAEYHLAHARLLPLVGPDDQPVRLPAAPAYALCFRVAPPPGYEVIWQHREGSLARKSR